MNFNVFSNALLKSYLSVDHFFDCTQNLPVYEQINTFVKTKNYILRSTCNISKIWTDTAVEYTSKIKF
jgi:hypothetical protein